MYAIIRTGGKQYKVQAGDVLQIDKIANELGSEFDLKDILMVGGDKVYVGTPTVAGAKVTVVVTKQAKTRKLFVFKKKRRHGYRKFQTHKQDFTELFIKAITSPDGKVEKTDTEAKVNNMAEDRKKRIQDKMETRKESVSKGIGQGSKAAGEVEKAVKKTATAKKAVKKVVKKAAPKAATKKAAPKKAVAKKKTTKKA